MVTSKQHKFKFAKYMEKGLEIQKWKNILGYSEASMQERFGLSEADLKRMYSGDIVESDSDRFTSVYFELKRDIDKYNKENNSRAMVKLLVEGDFYNKKVFYKLLRLLIDYTQQELATTLDVSLSAIRAWEQGKSSATGGNRIVLYEMIPRKVREQAELRKLGETIKNDYSFEIVNDNEIISESNSIYTVEKNKGNDKMPSNFSDSRKVKVKSVEQDFDDGAARISKISDFVTRMNQS